MWPQLCFFLTWEILLYFSLFALVYPFKYFSILEIIWIPQGKFILKRMCENMFSLFFRHFSINFKGLEWFSWIVIHLIEDSSSLNIIRIVNCFVKLRIFRFGELFIDDVFCFISCLISIYLYIQDKFARWNLLL